MSQNEQKNLDNSKEKLTKLSSALRQNLKRRKAVKNSDKEKETTKS